MAKLTPEQELERWPDGAEAYPASQQTLDGYQHAREQLARFQAPLLVGSDKPHGRMFVACFDGTSNDKDKKPDELTNVAIFKDQIKVANRQGFNNVKAQYQAGVGTQDDVRISELDGAVGYSYGPRMEQMYYDFCVQARHWKIEDPKAEISLAATGFSRGAVTAALFTRMVEERGIQNPDGMILQRNAQGLVTRMAPTQPNLVPPGQTAQMVGLFDPVATGQMNRVDVRLPPSVVSGFQITAIDERRDAFKSKQIIDPGLSADGRFLAVRVGGAHCDIGGSYQLNGLSTRNGNMMAAYLNGASDVPFLAQRTVPTAPEMNVIHRSEQHREIYTTLAADLTGSRRSIERLTAPADTLAGAVYDRVFSNTHDAQPRNPTLSQGLRFHKVRVPQDTEDPSLPAFFKDRPQPDYDNPPLRVWIPLSQTGPDIDRERDPRSRSPTDGAPGAQTPSLSGSRLIPRTADDDYLDRFFAATDRGDRAARADLTRDYAQLPQVQGLDQQVREQLADERQQALQTQAQQQQELAQQPAMRNPYVMRM